MYDVLIIGAGPSGMMCAYTAALRGLSVAVCDPNRQQGRKLRITGKGRCNITNNCDIKTFMNNIPGDGRFLYSALNRFSPADTIDFFINNGLPVKTERGNRVFPESDNANDVADLVVKLCLDSGVVFIRDTIVFTEKIEDYFVSKGKDNSYESDALCIFLYLESQLSHLLLGLL